MIIKRYNPTVEYWPSSGGEGSVEVAEMEEDKNGDYVKYDDIKHLLERSDNNDCAVPVATQPPPKSAEADFAQS